MAVDLDLKRHRLNVNKAGLQGVDTEQVNAIILKASEGSSFHAKELRREAANKDNANKILAKISALTQAEILRGLEEADDAIEKCESERQLDRTIVHVDLDAFYAAVELRDQPHLRDQPVAVGGNSMLSTSNYVARSFGVRAGMPGFIARQLCPQLCIVPLNFHKYKSVAKQVQSILSMYDANFVSGGLDEAYLDLTGHLMWRSQSEDDQRTFTVTVTKECVCCPDEDKSRRRSIYTFDSLPTTGLTCSAGIGSNTTLAKICSDWKKPNNQFELEPSRQAVLHFMRALPVGKVHGIGKVSESLFNALGVHTCGDVFKFRAKLFAVGSPASKSLYLRCMLGTGSTYLQHENTAPKSRSCERTFQPPLQRGKEIYGKCRELCEQLLRRLQQETEFVPQTLTVKMKTVDFELRTRSAPLTCTLDQLDQVYDVASQLIQAESLRVDGQLRLRLLGVRISNLDDEPAGPATDSTRDSTRSDHCPECKENFASFDECSQHYKECLDRTRELVLSVAREETARAQRLQQTAAGNKTVRCSQSPRVARKRQCSSESQAKRPRPSSNQCQWTGASSQPTRTLFHYVANSHTKKTG